MKIIKKIVLTAIWLSLGLFIAISIALHIPSVQHWTGATVAEMVEKKIGAHVEIGRIDIGFFNRIIIDGLRIDDQRGHHLLYATRLSAKIAVPEIATGRIRVSSAQLFGSRFNIIQDARGGEMNFQFIIDSLKSKDNKKKTPLDLQINSFIIRRGYLCFRRQYEAPRRDRFSLSDVELQQISSHIVINELTDSTLDVKLKRLSFREKSGLQLRNLAFSLRADSKKACLSGLKLTMPNSQLNTDSITATYQYDHGHLQMPTLRYQGLITMQRLTASDIAFVVPSLRGDDTAVSAALQFEGTSTQLRARHIEIHSNQLFSLDATADIQHQGNGWTWFADIHRLEANAPELWQKARKIASAYNQDLNDEQYSLIANKLGRIEMKGEAGISDDKARADIDVSSLAGSLSFAATRNAHHIEATLRTSGFDIGSITSQPKLGQIEGEAQLHGDTGSKATLTTDIRHIDIGGYSLQGVHAEASTQHFDFKNIIDAALKIDISDPALSFNATATWNNQSAKGVSLQARIAEMRPQRLHITDRWGDAVFSFGLDANADKLTTNANWHIAIDNLVKSTDEGSFFLDHFIATSVSNGHRQEIVMQSDFGHGRIEGQIDFGAIRQSIMAIIADKLPTMPGLPTEPYKQANDFSFSLHLDNTLWAQSLAGIPIEIESPFDAAGEISDATRHIYADIKAPAFCYDETFYRGADIKISSPMGMLVATGEIDRMMSNGKPFHWNIHAQAADNRITGGIEFDNHSQRLIKGRLNADAGFALNAAGQTAANIHIHQSHINFGDSLWTVEPATIDYSQKMLRISDFAVRHNKQYVTLSGIGTESHGDTITARLKDVDISYILNLVDFHTVDFDGLATGRATVSGLFSRQPKAATDLQVSDFLFEKGRMGTLYAHAAYNNELECIDIDSYCIDTFDTTAYSLATKPYRRTLIDGFVAPIRGEFGIRFTADGSRLEFMQEFCSSFLSRVDGAGWGELRLDGTFKKPELTGQITAEGAIDVTSLNTTYSLCKAKAQFVHNKIELMGDTITDRDGHYGIVTGAVSHQNLKRFTYDIDINAHNLLSYDTHDFGEFSFYGTAYATGNCRIMGRSGEVNIDVNAQADDGSMLVYNVASPSELTERDFVVWHDAQATDTVSHNGSAEEEEKGSDDSHFTTNIHFNVIGRVSPNSTLRLIMDPASGDYIDLMGSGTLRCQYYNKGSFDIFGNYVIDHGLYKLTIQNVIRRDFRFLSGGTIAFGGDPFAASLSLKAQYTLNGVSLSDLGLGNSFSSNNVRVDCLMNITGTAGSPHVDFSLDLPTMNADARQMVYSLINSSEDLNNQVLYLLAVGRFYQQPNSNIISNANQQNQTSLAMQSILSGTISQQINTLLSGVTKNSNFQFGANISTGAEGFNNAEYEGLFSGQLLNNRLLFDGQFGYRDKANATSSFIGDFDIKYLLTPSGNIAVRVYNQSNDRYFTRSSLNTQGLGLILKHDFNKLFPLWKQKK